MKHSTARSIPFGSFPKVAFLCAMAVAATACSHRDIYDTVQRDQQLECQRYPDARYEDCMARVSKSFDEYDRELESLDEGGPAR